MYFLYYRMCTGISILEEVKLNNIKMEHLAFKFEHFKSDEFELDIDKAK